MRLHSLCQAQLLSHKCVLQDLRSLGLRKTGMDRALHAAQNGVRFPVPVVYNISFCRHHVLVAVEKSLCEKPQMDTQLHHTSQSKWKVHEFFSVLLPCFIFTKLVLVEYRRLSFTNDSEALLSLGERFYNDNCNIAILY